MKYPMILKNQLRASGYSTSNAPYSRVNVSHYPELRR
jgi:hypothetical protein